MQTVPTDTEQIEICSAEGESGYLISLLNRLRLTSDHRRLQKFSSLELIRDTSSELSPFLLIEVGLTREKTLQSCMYSKFSALILDFVHHMDIDIRWTVSSPGYMW